MKVVVYSNLTEIIILPLDGANPVGLDVFFAEDDRDLDDYDSEIVDLPLIIHSGINLDSHG